MFWITSPVDPVWSGSQVDEFRGSGQTTITGLYLPTDGSYAALEIYQQNKLRRLIGRSPLGSWRLLIADAELLDDGQLFRWAIEIACKHRSNTMQFNRNQTIISFFFLILTNAS